ncbi:MAG: hypothetical protein KC777_29375 [Cyanobacteria bacterium HKST-UBA02]|nr:hypothetical protein [Cyanobacteria bacterium HKST-UBA02]
MLNKPPDAIPDDLTAAEYFQLGNWFWEERDLDKARDALSRAVILDPEGESGRAARDMLSTRIPAHPVDQEAFNTYRDVELHLGFTNRVKAVAKLEKLIADHPDFEWPYRSLADLMIRKGDIPKARDLLEKSLAINPVYAAALVSMARIHIADTEYDAALEMIDKAMNLTAFDESLPDMRRAVEMLAALES